MDYKIGIDIGGTNTVIGLVHNSGEIVKKETISTKNQGDFVSYIGKVIQLIKDLIPTNESLKGIGVGAPNGNIYKGTIEFAPNLPWKGILPIKDALTNAFNCPVYITNDANAAAMGEKIYGGAKNLNDFIVITLGTGVGSGIYANGNIIYGHDGFAGEIGHVISVPEGRKCACGRKGCIEAYASAQGIVQTYKELIDLEENNNYLDAKNICEKAINGDVAAIKAFDETARLLGFTLANTVAHTSPEVIFIFGGIANAGNILLEPLRRYLDSYLLPIYKSGVKIAPSQLKEDNAAILGACALIE